MRARRRGGDSGHRRRLVAFRRNTVRRLQQGQTTRLLAACASLGARHAIVALLTL